MDKHCIQIVDWHAENDKPLSNSMTTRYYYILFFEYFFAFAFTWKWTLAAKSFCIRSCVPLKLSARYDKRLSSMPLFDMMSFAKLLAASCWLFNPDAQNTSNTKLCFPSAYVQACRGLVTRVFYHHGSMQSCHRRHRMVLRLDNTFLHNLDVYESAENRPHKSRVKSVVFTWIHDAGLLIRLKLPDSDVYISLICFCIWFCNYLQYYVIVDHVMHLMITLWTLTLAFLMWVHTWSLLYSIKNNFSF